MQVFFYGGRGIYFLVLFNHEKHEMFIKDGTHGGAYPTEKNTRRCGGTLFTKLEIPHFFKSQIEKAGR